MNFSEANKFEFVQDTLSTSHKNGGKQLLSHRYVSDGKSNEILNSIQLKARDDVASKVKNNVYHFEDVTCCVCNQSAFEPLAEKDRYGLFFPVKVCVSCGLIQTAPRMDERAYVRFYNEEYRKLYGGSEGPTEQFFKDQFGRGVQILRFLVNNGVVDGRRRTVLDVGCGAGGIVKVFRDFGWTACGIDLGLQYLEYGREKHGLELSEATIQDLSTSRKFDLIIYSHVFEHLLDPVKELAKIRTLLNPHGLLFIELPSVKNVHNAYGGDFLAVLQNAHTYHFTLRSLENLLGKCGFSLVFGSEFIQAAFSPALSAVPEIQSDYLPVLEYLHKIEREFCLQKGIEFLREGNFGDAQQMFESVVGRFPQDLQALKGLAASLYSLGRSNDAIQYWNQAKKLEG